MDNFLNSLQLNRQGKTQVTEYSPLVLAYIGDSVFDMLVRTMILDSGNMQVNKIHQKSKSLVNARTQSIMYGKIEEMVSEEELSVLKRGRNAKSFTSAKNAHIQDYRRATGLEALFGYLYLKGENERIIQLFNICLS